jgi:hypothetical protein
MPVQKRSKVVIRRRTKRRQTETAQIVANSYCLRHYGVRCSGGTPRHLLLRESNAWIIPVVFTSPGHGVVGEVGTVVVDAATDEVVGASARGEVRAAVARLAREKGDELATAFHKASKL